VSTGRSTAAWWVRDKRRAVRLATCVLAASALVAGAVVVLIGLSRGAASPGWTGAAVKVPYCPADADGCRIFVVHEPEANPGASGPVIAHEDWSGPTTMRNVVLPAGTYSVSAEGCTGYKIANTVVSISSGFHIEVDLGPNWEMPGFLGRTCPGFGPHG
jgi:hypothetical protein